MVFIFMLTDLNTRETGEMTNNMVKERKLGLTAVSTMDTTSTPRKKEEELTHGQMVTSTLETGEIMPLMAMVSISGLMAESTAASGKIT